MLTILNDIIFKIFSNVNCSQALVNRAHDVIKREHEDAYKILLERSMYSI